MSVLSIEVKECQWRATVRIAMAVVAAAVVMAVVAVVAVVVAAAPQNACNSGFTPFLFLDFSLFR